MEQLVDELRCADQRRDPDRAGEDRAEDRRPLHERAATDAERAPVRERAAHLLLERLEEAGRDDEDDRPQAVERGVTGVAELTRGEDLEPVRGDAGDDETGTDRVGPLGKRAVLGRVHQPLRSMCHSPSSVPGNPAILRPVAPRTGRDAERTRFYGQVPLQA